MEKTNNKIIDRHKVHHINNYLKRYTMQTLIKKTRITTLI